MEIRLSKHSGFCFGVERAVDAVEQALLGRCKNVFSGSFAQDGAQPRKIYTLGEVIHNPVVVEDLKRRGAVPVQSVEEVESGATLVVRAHGASPEIFEHAAARNIRVIDATCPFVRRIHEKVHGCSANGYDIVVVGQRDHPEVRGICGWSAMGAHVLRDAEEARAQRHVLRKIQKACVVAQTTIERERFRETAAFLQTLDIPELAVYDTICSATVERQLEAEELSKCSDCVLVIGGKSSSNTRKIFEICKKNCKNTHLIENVYDSPLEIIHCDGIISMIAGASTPNWMMMEVATRMSELEKNLNEVTMSNGEETVMDNLQTDAETTVAVEEVKAEEVASDAEVTDEDSFAEAFEKTMVRIRNGQILTGTIVQITDSEVCVNIGYKSDGFIPRSEFSSDSDAGLEGDIKEGDEIEVEIVKVNDGEGNVLLSHKSVLARKAWEEFIAEVEDEGKVFEAVGKEVVKGGLIAYIQGVRTFIPASQVSLRYVENLGEFVGQPLRLKILEIDKSKRRVVASQKKVLAEESAAKKKEIWEKLEVSAQVPGIVRRLTDFGAFVDIGGIDGLVHVTELAWGRVKHPSDVLSVNDEITVVIKALDPEKERISLGYKELQPKPWASAADRYPVGSVVEGRVVRIVPFGAFVALEPTIDGLVHISQVDTKRIAKVEDSLNIGDMIRCKVLGVDPEAKRISLSRREVLMEEMPIEDIVSDDIAQELHAEEPNGGEISEPQSATTSLADFFPKIED